MITINNSIFDVQGSSKKDKIYGITLSGNEDILIQNCTFETQGYSAILNNSTGNVIIEDCNFKCENNYNPIEGGQAVDNGDVLVKNCEFVGAPGNNYINFYQVRNNSQHKVLNCSFEPTVDNNIIRLSNKNNSNAQFKIEDCRYDYADGQPTEYTGFMLCQDYTNKNGVKQDFSRYTVTLENVYCNGEKITEGGAAEGCIYYVYEDGAGIITGENDPAIIIK